MRFFFAAVAMTLIGTGCSGAQAQDVAKACNLECLQQKVDALTQRVDELTSQMSKSIKSGQNVTLHTQYGHPGGCLTYVGPSGDQGGPVSWNANCSHDTLWTIN